MFLGFLIEVVLYMISYTLKCIVLSYDSEGSMETFQILTMPFMLGLPSVTSLIFSLFKVKNLQVFYGNYLYIIHKNKFQEILR